MDADSSLFLDLAAIAGIFVGFGSLIIFSRGDQAGEADLHMLRGVATAGLLALVAGLLPVALAGFGLEGRALWMSCSAIVLITIWFALLHPSFRPVLVAQMRYNRGAALFFWVFLELPIQLPLVLILVGAFSEHAAALYVASLIVHLFESAQLLVQVVFARVRRANVAER